MYFSEDQYVYRDKNLYCKMYCASAREAYTEAAKLVRMLNSLESVDRLPHPAIDFNPVEITCDVGK